MRAWVPQPPSPAAVALKRPASARSTRLSGQSPLKGDRARWGKVSSASSICARLHTNRLYNHRRQLREAGTYPLQNRELDLLPRVDGVAAAAAAAATASAALAASRAQEVDAAPRRRRSREGAPAANTDGVGRRAQEPTPAPPIRRWRRRRRRLAAEEDVAAPPPAEEAARGAPPSLRRVQQRRRHRPRAGDEGQARARLRREGRAAALLRARPGGAAGSAKGRATSCARLAQAGERRPRCPCSARARRRSASGFRPTTTARRAGAERSSRLLRRRSRADDRAAAEGQLAEVVQAIESLARRYRRVGSALGAEGE